MNKKLITTCIGFIWLLCQPLSAAPLQNHVFVELGGPAILYSINYERLFTEQFTGRIGLSYGTLVTSERSITTTTTQTTIYDSVKERSNFLMVPLTLSYLAGESAHKFELGGGLEWVHATKNTDFDTTDFSDVFSTSGVVATGILGYRYQPENASVVFRIAFTPVFNSRGFLAWVGISIGGRV